MYFILGNLQNEYSSLLQEINNYEFCTVSSIEDLKSGFVISQIILHSIRRQDLFTVIQGFSKENILARWKVIIDFMRIHFHLNLNDFLPDEIQNDAGVLFIACKMIIKSLSKNPKKYSQGRMWSSLNTSSSTIYNTFNNNDQACDPVSDLEDEKTSIHQWLQDLKLIPPGIFMHEFMYRIRYGISLIELIKRLETEPARIDGVVGKPKSVADCIKNINFVLRFLRRSTNMNRRFLYTSASVYEGNQEIIYGLLADVRAFYVKKKNLSVRRSPSPKRIMVHPATPKPSVAKPAQISTTVKHSVVEWITSLGLLQQLIFSDSFTKNTLENGTLVCETILKLFRVDLEYFRTPQNLEECQQNYVKALKFLENKPGFKLSSEKIIVSEESSWTILYEIMNNHYDKSGKSKIIVFQDLEEKILEWLKSESIISHSIVSIFDVIPLVQSGEILAELAKTLFDATKLRPNLDSLEVIKSYLKIFKKNPDFPKRFTKSSYEIYKGELVVVIGILEDLYNFSQTHARAQPKPLQNVNEFNSFKKAKELEECLMRKDLKVGSLTSPILPEFKNGLKLCEAIERVLGVRIENLVLAPRTKAQALWNLRKGFEVLYGKFEFPVKYVYLDDLIISGDGETIRDFLNDLIKLS